MTVLSPMGRVPRRRPVPARGYQRRRVGPWLAFLGVLVLVAIVVWWQVLGSGHKTDASACGPRVSDAMISLTARDVQVRVYNATDKSGLAKTVADGLKRRGFVILTATNDPLGRPVPGVGEIRYGESGAQQALYVSFRLPGSKLVPDSRTDAVVDVAVGAGYEKLATETQASEAKVAAISAADAGNRSC